MKFLIVGGYGAFGLILADRLARTPSNHIVIAGRNKKSAEHAICELQSRRQQNGKPTASLSAESIDATACSSKQLSATGADVVVNASGPFQRQDYHLAKAAIAAGCHYVDLADGRDFVTGIASLDAPAKAAGVTIISGASTTPALTSAVVNEFQSQFRELRTIEFAISPGNRTKLGLSTTKGVLSYVGRPIACKRNGEITNVIGWQGLARRTFPQLGNRWTSFVEVADLDLFPEALPNIETVDFRAGLEVGIYHIGLWTLSWLVRARLLKSAEAFARPLHWVKENLAGLGSNNGGMIVTMHGTSLAGAPVTRHWAIVGRDGDGLHVPTLAAQILCERFASGENPPSGARACFCMLPLADFEQAIGERKIEFLTF